jgi:hypothetical protein
MDKSFPLLAGLPVALLLSGCSIQESNPAETEGATQVETRRPGGLRLLLNSDGGDAALMAFEPPITPRQLCRAVNEIEGSQVGVFIQCIQWSDEQMLYPTQVTEVYAKPISEDHKRDFEKYPGIRRWARNVDAMLEAGEDPLEIWSRRSREAGMQFWPSLRMNDIHKDWSERWPSFRSQWERANPQVRLGSAVPDRYLHHSNRSPQPSHGYSWAMDYALEEVRDRKLAIIEEVCTNYDVDGFEMDFLSHPYYFKRGEEARGMPLMTEFVRQVRDRLDRIGRQKGRKLMLLARVPPKITLCEAIGFDVKTWIREELVDVLSPATRGYLDMTSDWAGFVELAKGTKVAISGGLSDLYVRDYTGQKTGRASIEMLRAAASAAWQSGVTSLHLFNYDAHASGKGKPGTLFSPDELQALKEIGDPERIARKDKHYYITREMGGLAPEAGGEMQLPTEIQKVLERKELSFIVGDDVESAKQDKVLESTSLLLSLEGYDRWDDDLRIELNGQRLRGRAAGDAIRFEDVVPNKGKNLLALTLRSRSPSRQHPIRVQGVELFIDYRP